MYICESGSILDTRSFAKNFIFVFICLLFNVLLSFDNHQRPVAANYTLSANKRVASWVETIVLKFAYNGIGKVTSNYDFRRNKIPGAELAQSHTAFVANAEEILEQKSEFLADVEFNSIEFGMKDVVVDMQRLIKYYSDLDNTRYCMDCRIRNPNYSRTCECGSENLVTGGFK